MTTIPNNEIVVPLQHVNTVVPLQDTYTVYPELDSADEVEPKNSHPQMPNRSTRGRRSAITNDYIIYLQEQEFDIELEDDHTSLNDAKVSIHFTKYQMP